jgi:CAAX protease family protein
MLLHTPLRPTVLIAAALALAPMLVAALFPERPFAWVRARSLATQLTLPALLVVPYAIVAASFGVLRPGWFALYACLPVAIAGLARQARTADPAGLGNWRDYFLLAALGLAVDLRWLEPAWPRRFTPIGKMLLLDAGIYAFLVIRELDGVGFDLRLRPRDLLIGLREFAFYAPIAIPLGLALGFLHLHEGWSSLTRAAFAFVFTFLFIAIPEELFFRGWLQNLLERRLGRTTALIVTAILFGLSHWNKRTHLFNWRYVLLAALAGIFYGRAWRANRRVGASVLTHATVDTVWSLFLR